jgi:hypothetical protein
MAAGLVDEKLRVKFFKVLSKEATVGRGWIVYKFEREGRINPLAMTKQRWLLFVGQRSIECGVLFVKST